MQTSAHDDDDVPPFDNDAIDAHEARERPKIRNGVDIARVTDEAIAALKHDPEVYVRAGSLSRIIRHDGTERNSSRALSAALHHPLCVGAVDPRPAFDSHASCPSAKRR